MAVEGSAIKRNVNNKTWHLYIAVWQIGSIALIQTPSEGLCLKIVLHLLKLELSCSFYLFRLHCVGFFKSLSSQLLIYLLKCSPSCWFYCICNIFRLVLLDDGEPKLKPAAFHERTTKKLKNKFSSSLVFCSNSDNWFTISNLKCLISHFIMCTDPVSVKMSLHLRTFVAGVGRVCCLAHSAGGSRRKPLSADWLEKLHHVRALNYGSAEGEHSTI